MFIQLKNGSILTDHQQLDALVARNPTTSKPGTEAARRVVRYVKSVRIEWETSGTPLDSTSVTVEQMLEEFDNLLDELGLDPDHVSTYTIRED